ncbi:LOW QUALITY PROTEIN: Rho GTPase-activating protein 17, partial [Galemys pyrenaicus]
AGVSHSRGRPPGNRGTVTPGAGVLWGSAIAGAWAGGLHRLAPVTGGGWDGVSGGGQWPVTWSLSQVLGGRDWVPCCGEALGETGPAATAEATPSRSARVSFVVPRTGPASLCLGVQALAHSVYTCPFHEHEGGFSSCASIPGTQEMQGTQRAQVPSGLYIRCYQGCRPKVWDDVLCSSGLVGGAEHLALGRPGHRGPVTERHKTLPPGLARSSADWACCVQHIERRLDTVRSMCHQSHKRLMACFQGQHGTDTERRHKKLPLTALAQNVQEASTQLEDSLLGKMLETCGDAENQLALELSQYEVFIEKEIVDPLYMIAEVEIPNIQKQRKQLAKLVLDWDSVRARWNQAHKSSGTNFQGLPSKIDTLKEEMDEAGNKVEQCKDQLAADMYNFMAKEGEYGKFFVTLLEAQADYHRKALAVLEKALPEMRAHQGNVTCVPADKWAEKPAFGTPLEEHLKRSGREIALPIEACVMLLLETGMKEEGLFRIGAGASKLKKLKAALDCSTSHLDEFYSDPHAVAGELQGVDLEVGEEHTASKSLAKHPVLTLDLRALKSYLRELPEPLMTFNLYEEWTQVASVQDQDKKLQDLWRTCQKLPPQNFVNFRYLIKFLAKLAQTSDVNKMTPSNIAIVLGPNLLWAKNEGTLAEMAAATSVHVVAVIEPIIQHADWFFPEEVEFNVSEAFVPLATPNSNHSPLTGNDSDSGTLERKRPASMAVMEGDLVKKESFGVKLMDFQAHRRGGTLNRKHLSPAFQPPLPPTDGSTLAPAGPEPPPQGARAESSAGGGTVPNSAGLLEQGPSPGDGSPPKPKDAAAAPAPGRNSSQPTTGTSQAQPTAGSHQLSVGPAHNSAGPSPHTLRRAVKKPAPAPPKPGNPPPGHAGGQSSPATSQHPPSLSPKPTTRSPSPPTQHPSQAPGQPGAPSQLSGPRRYSSSLPPIQAPNHPPPQPPTQATPLGPGKPGVQGPPGEAGLEQPAPTPPQTPTPPSTPPLGKQNLGLHTSQTQAVSNPETAQPHTGTLPRPRPVPKPRNRPSVPPPPHPPGTHSAVDGSLTNAAPTASKIVTDASSRVSEALRIFPDVHSDSASKDLPGRILLDMDNDTESTALRPPPSALPGGPGRRTGPRRPDSERLSVQEKRKKPCQKQRTPESGRRAAARQGASAGDGRRGELGEWRAAAPAATRWPRAPALQTRCRALSCEVRLCSRPRARRHALRRPLDPPPQQTGCDSTLLGRQD